MSLPEKRTERTPRCPVTGPMPADPGLSTTDLPESVYLAARKSLMEASGYQIDDPHYGIDSPWWKKLADAAVDAAVAELQGLLLARDAGAALVLRDALAHLVKEAERA